MALELLIPHVPPEAGVAALAQLRAEHAALYPDARPVAAVGHGHGWDERWIDAAAVSRDAHQVKLIEACRRGLTLAGDAAFVAAASLVSEPSCVPEVSGPFPHHATSGGGRRSSAAVRKGNRRSAGHVSRWRHATGGLGDTVL
jgi:hypothetical protein